jgi:hypothetical protein
MSTELEVRQKLAIQKTGLGVEKDNPRAHLGRTRVMFHGQEEWYHECLSVEDDYFKRRVLDDMRMRESQEGKSHEELTYIMGHDHAEEQDNPFKKAVRDIERTANTMSGETKV